MKVCDAANIPESRQMQDVLPAAAVHTYKWRSWCSVSTAQRKEDNVPLLSTSSSAGRINKSCFGFTGRQSTCNKCHRAPKQSHVKNLISHFLFFTAALRRPPNCWAGWREFMRLWPLLHFFFIHTPAARHNYYFFALFTNSGWALARLRFISCSTRSLSPHSGLVNNSKRRIAIFPELLREGSNATLWLRNQICEVPGKCSRPHVIVRRVINTFAIQVHVSPEQFNANRPVALEASTVS